MKDKEKQIEEMAREIARVLFEIRQDMTSVIRYIRHELDKEKKLYSNFTLGNFIDRHLKYRQLADETSRNILKNLNENTKLKEIENLCVDIARNGFPKDSVVLTQSEFDEFIKDQAEVKFLKSKIEEQARKETAREIINMLKDYYGNISIIDSISIRYGVYIE